jgi:hypothetical protein
VDVLKTLESVGLPGWVLIIASMVFIAKQVGALDWAFNRLADAQEHHQGSEAQQANFERLQISWQQERLSTILEENESFIRESISKKLDAIDSKIYRLEMTMAQHRDTLAVIGREVYELKRELQAREDEPES